MHSAFQRLFESFLQKCELHPQLWEQENTSVTNTHPYTFLILLPEEGRTFFSVRNLPILAAPWAVLPLLASAGTNNPKAAPEKEKEKELNHTTHQGSGVYKIVSQWLAANTVWRVVSASVAGLHVLPMHQGCILPFSLLNANTQTPGKGPSAIPRQDLPHKARRSWVSASCLHSQCTFQMEREREAGSRGAIKHHIKNQDSRPGNSATSWLYNPGILSKSP